MTRKAESMIVAEGIFKGNHTQSAVPLKRTLVTFFRKKVTARRVGDKI